MGRSERSAGHVRRERGFGDIDIVLEEGKCNRKADAVSIDIQNQIAAKQRELQELSSDKDMTPEEKMKKRQEIRKEIAALKQELRQRSCISYRETINYIER